MGRRTAQGLLSDLPTRLAHVAGVARRAELVADLVDDGDLLIAAARLHEVGYSPQLARTGFHPFYGAEFLREQGAPPRRCALVANHSCDRAPVGIPATPRPIPRRGGQRPLQVAGHPEPSAALAGVTTSTRTVPGCPNLMRRHNLALEICCRAADFVLLVVVTTDDESVEVTSWVQGQDDRVVLDGMAVTG